MNLQNNLKEFRKINKFTQSEISKKINVVPRTYANYELGSSEPSINTLINISKLFNISVDTLIGNKSPNIHLNGLTEEQKNLVQEIIELNDIMCIKLNAYLQGLKQGEKELQTIKQSKNIL